jgi:glycyl-tRNA synthetase beta chain
MGREISGVDQVSDFLLELRSEEIPARMQAGARAELEKLFRGALNAAGVSLGGLQVWSTPRRLTLIARGLPLATEAVSEEVKGPKTSAPEQALAGFLRKTGLTKEQLTERDGVFFAVTEKPGRATADVLAEAIPAIVRGFSWPKSQRWGAASLSTESLRWVRPLQGIVALLDGVVVDCEVGGIVAGRETMGHRFHSHGAIAVENADTYADQLRAPCSGRS